MPETLPDADGPVAARVAGGDEDGDARTPAVPRRRREPTPGYAVVRRFWPAGLSLIVYLLLASTLYGNHDWLSNTHIPICACDDQVQQTWFLDWPAYAITHGRNPLFSSWLNAPDGANVAINTSMPLLGIVSAPITWLFGPVATYNVLLRLGFALSSFSMCLVLRRWTRWWPAAFVGGLLYGFSAYMVGHGLGHVLLTFLPLPPVIFLLLDEILGRRRFRPWQSGVMFGLVISAQFLISPEVLVDTMIMAAAALVYVVLANRRRIAELFPGVATSFGWSALVIVVLLAYPVWFALAGPQHLVGPPHSLAELALYPGDLLGAVLPTGLLRFGPSSWIAAANLFTGGSLTENGMYLGIPMLVLLAVMVVAFRRRRVLVLAVLLAATSWVLSLGSHLTVDGHNTGIPLPFDILFHIPIVQDAEAVRFSFLTAMFVAASLAIGLDMLHTRLLAPRPVERQQAISTSRISRRLVATGVPVALAVTVAIPLYPATSYASVPTDVPPLFTTSLLERIPTNSTVLSYPYPIDPILPGMLDQAVAHMHFKIVGGYAAVPQANGAPTYGPIPLQPPQMQQLFAAALAGGPAEQSSLPPLGPSVPALRAFLSDNRISTVVWYPIGADPMVVVRYLTTAIGPPTHLGGVTEWFDVPKRLNHQLPR
jgi:hypothetical protein